MTPVETPNLDAVLADLEALRNDPRIEAFYAAHPELRPDPPADRGSDGDD